jgi:glc operon protein GlcG
MRQSVEIQLSDARRMVGAIQAAAREAGHSVTVVVCDAAGRLLLLERDDDAAGVTVELAPAKARTAALLGLPSGHMEAALNKGYSALSTMAGFVLLGGGVEIRCGGRVVGGIGVSGAPSAAEDESLARAGLAVQVSDTASATDFS